MLKDDLPHVEGMLPGPNASIVLKKREEVIPHAIGCPYPVVIKRGEGAMIEDVDGNKFLDWVGGVGVLNAGYSDPRIIEAVKEQADKYLHAMINIVTHTGYIELADKLCSLAKVKGSAKKAFFANSGAEADENAIKVAKAYTKRPNIIVFSGAFHGRTYLTMTMTSKKAYATGQGTLAGGVFRALFPYYYRNPAGLPKEKQLDYYIKSIENIFEECAAPDTIAAIVVEPLQGEGGFIPAPLEWVKAIDKICRSNGILLVADEVQSGFCRTGRMFATEYWQEVGVTPDIIASAKSIAAGIPLSCVIASKEIMDSVPNGTIGGTFCGNALACAASLKLLEIMEKEDYAGRSLKIGKVVMERYKKMQAKYKVIGDVRGLGAMIGMEFVKDKSTKEAASDFTKLLIKECYENGLIIESCGTYSNAIRFLSPLVITDKQLEAGLDILENAIAKVSKDTGLL